MTQGPIAAVPRRPQLLRCGALLVALAASFACSGGVGPNDTLSTPPDDSAMAGAAGAVNGGGGGSAGEGAGGVVGVGMGMGGAPPPSDELDPGRTVLRRLTEAEYNNTVRDLLHTEARPGNNFTDADTVAEEGFDTLGEVLSLPPVLFAQYESAATELVDELFARPAGDAARAEVLICEGTDDACARSVVETFAKRAFRRPVEAVEVDRIMTVKAKAQEFGLSPEEGLKAALKGVLVSPHFLFRVERSAVGNVSPEPVTQFELATRLSYFLWSSMPDAELMAAAEAGTLTQTLPAQLQRMLDDEKASEFAANFGGQWLHVRHMEELQQPSESVFPQYDAALRDSAKHETLAFFESLYKEGRPLEELLNADYTIANARLAQHYGIEAPAEGFEKVSLAQVPRRGFLTQASFLVTSSHPGSTSPARRGAMVLDRFMCVTIPPPPDDAEVDLPTPDPGTTRREQFAVHSSVPKCASCHTLMDPIGFGFERFDAIGTYRTEENGGMIDATGTLLTPEGGMPYTSPVELVELLAQDSRFAGCVTEKLLTYAVGRSFANNKAKAYTAGLAQKGLAAGKADWRSWLEHVVTSEAFLTRRGEAQ